MISDVLFDAASQLDYYLTDEVYASVYTGPLRERLTNLRAEMDAIRAELDRVPSASAAGGPHGGGQ